MSRNFRNIRAWRLADDLAVQVYAETRDFPKDELYGLTSQLRPAVVSVAANIAEGSGRGHIKEYLKFLHIARGSLTEVEYLLHFANRIGYTTDNDYVKLENMRSDAARTLHGLITSVQKESENKPTR